MSSSLAIGIARAESSSKFESSSTSSRQPPVTAAAARLPPEGPTQDTALASCLPSPVPSRVALRPCNCTA